MSVGRLHAGGRLAQQFEILDRAGGIADAEPDTMARQNMRIAPRSPYPDPVGPAAIARRRGGNGSIQP